MSSELMAPVAATPANTSGRLFSSIVILCVLGLAAAAWLWRVRVFEPERAQVRDALASSDRAYTGINAEVLALRRQLADERATATSEAARLNKLENDLAALGAQMAKPTTVESRLNIARIAHLVGIADAALRFETNPVAAADALSAAAEFLATTTDTAYDALESALYNDRQALLAVTSPDINALALRWAAAGPEVDALAWRQMAPPRPSEPPPLAGWQGVAIAMWQDLKRLVEVRDLTVADQALLDPARAGLVKEQIRTELTALRLAVYRRDSGNAKTSADRVGALLSAYFDVADPAVIRLQQSLDGLRTSDLAPVLPDLTATYTALDYLQRGMSGEQGIPSAPTLDPHSAPR